MPGPEVHNYVDRVLFGRSYWRVHREIDKPYRYLKKYHRVLFHDPLTATLIARKQYPNDPNAIAAAQCHIALDNICSQDRYLKRALERLARMDREKGKGTKATSATSHFIATDNLPERLRQLIDLLNRQTAPWVDPVLLELGEILKKLVSTHE